MVSRRLFCSCRIPIYRTHKCNFYTLKHSRGIAYNRRLVQQWQQLHHHAFSRFCIKEAGFKNLGHLVLEFSVITPSKLITYQVHIYIKTHLKIFKKHKYLEVRKLHFKKKYFESEIKCRYNFVQITSFFQFVFVLFIRKNIFVLLLQIECKSQ